MDTALEDREREVQKGEEGVNLLEGEGRSHYLVGHGIGGVMSGIL